MTACLVIGLVLLAIGAGLCNELRPAYAFRRSIAQYPLFGIVAGLFVWLGIVFLVIAALVAIVRHAC